MTDREWLAVQVADVIQLLRKADALGLDRPPEFREQGWPRVTGDVIDRLAELVSLSDDEADEPGDDERTRP